MFKKIKIREIGKSFVGFDLHPTKHTFIFHFQLSKPRTHNLSPKLSKSLTETKP